MTASYVDIQRGPNDWVFLETTYPSGGDYTFGTMVHPYLAFDASTEEYANGTFVVPQGLDAAGTVTFAALLATPGTTGGSGTVTWNVALTYGHRAVATTEAIDGAYTDEDSGDKEITDDEDDDLLHEVTWTETVANLGWVAGDQVFDRLSRYAASGDGLASDLYLLDFTIRVPLS